MTLRPEQSRALEYLRRRGKEAPLAEIRHRIVASFELLDSRLDGLSEEQTRRRPPSGGWCVQEVVDHLILSHRPGVVELRELIAGRRPEGGPIPASLLSEHPLETPWGEVREVLKSVHEDFLRALDEARDDLISEARAPVALVVKARPEVGGTSGVDGASEGTSKVGGTLLEWTEELSWKSYAILIRTHVLEHAAQIDRMLAE